MQRVTQTTVPWAILPSATHPFPELTNDYKAGVPVWREVPSEAYGYARDVLPPIYLMGGFMVSEPYTHEANEAVYAAFVATSGRYFARYTTRSRFTEDRAGLVAAIAS